MPAPHKVIATLADIDAIDDDLLPGILKTVRMGYDGKGQVRVRTRADVRAAFESMGQVTCLLEKMLPLAYEVSVLTARGFDGASSVYPIAENVQRLWSAFNTRYHNNRERNFDRQDKTCGRRRRYDQPRSS